jgi:hypothetical protein
VARKIASQQKIIFLGYPTGQIQIEITWAQCLEPRAVSKVHQYSKAVPNMGYTNCQWHFFWWSPWETPIKTKGQHSQTNAIQAYKMSIYLCNIYIYIHITYIYICCCCCCCSTYLLYLLYVLYHIPLAVRSIFFPNFQVTALPKGAHAVLQGLFAAILRLAVGSQGTCWDWDWGNPWWIGCGMLAMIQSGRKEKSYSGPPLVIYIYICKHACTKYICI